jgi:hypothetical protein
MPLSWGSQHERQGFRKDCFMLTGLRNALEKMGARTTDMVWRGGVMARFFFLVMVNSATSFRRLSLVVREVYFSGVQSLVIIMVSGLFVPSGLSDPAELWRRRNPGRAGGTFSGA